MKNPNVYKIIKIMNYGTYTECQIKNVVFQKIGFLKFPKTKKKNVSESVLACFVFL